MTTDTKIRTAERNALAAELKRHPQNSKAWGALAKSLRPLITKLARKTHRSASIDVDDLAQCAYELLPKLCRDWDPRRSPFESYLGCVLPKRLMDAVQKLGYLIPTPREVPKVILVEPDVSDDDDDGADNVWKFLETAEATDANPVSLIWAEQYLGSLDPVDARLLELMDAGYEKIVEISKVSGIASREITPRIDQLIKSLPWEQFRHL